MGMGKIRASLDEGRHQQPTVMRLIYASNHGGICNKYTDEILSISRSNNSRDNITGVLIITDEDFLQLLEGSRESVTNCFARILLDNRHRNVQILYANDAGLRLFPSWSMYSIKSSRVRKHSLVTQLRQGTFNPFSVSAWEVEQAFHAVAREMGLAKPRTQNGILRCP
jgi:hypothetical protein